MEEKPMLRRTFLTTAALGAVGGAAAFASAGHARSGTANTRGVEALRFGVASYSLRNFSRARAIEMMRALRTPYINVKSFHLEYDLSPAELMSGRREFEAGGLRIVGGGVITFEEDSDAEVQRYFEYAKHAGMPLIVATGDPRILPRVERFARRYDIQVAIHNHGPEDPFYPSPYEALAHIRNMDPRMGVCIDIGHTARAGTDVARAAADAGARLLDLHIKDLNDLDDRESQCVVGTGVLPIGEIFQQLLAMDFRGFANLEYEIDANDPLPGMMQSFAYMRGVLSGLNQPERRQ